MRHGCRIGGKTGTRSVSKKREGGTSSKVIKRVEKLYHGNETRCPFGPGKGGVVNMGDGE